MKVQIMFLMGSLLVCVFAVKLHSTRARHIEPTIASVPVSQSERKKPLYLLYGRFSSLTEDEDFTLLEVGSITRRLGLKAGDRIIQYNSKEVTSASMFYLDFIQDSFKNPTTIKVERDGKFVLIEVTPSNMARAYKEGGGSISECDFVND